jgi:hypothetical protein
VIMGGFMTLGEFHRKASSLPPESRIFYRSNPRLQQLWLPIADLHPLQSLFRSAKSWEGNE